MEIDTDLPPLSINRKRAASSSPAPEKNHDAQSTALRARYTSELDDIGLIPLDQAWDVDLPSILEATEGEDHDDEDDGAPDTTAGADPWPDSRMDGVSEAMMTNLRALSRDAKRELVVLCVLGDLDGHYWLLEALLPVLRTITPDVRFFAIATDVAGRRERLFGQRSQAEWAYLGAVAKSAASAAAEGQIRFVQPSSRMRMFTRLGLLHPLGGGQQPLDAIVVLERRGDECRRRMVLPFGWGAGRLVLDEAGGWMVRGRLMEVLREGIEEVCAEWKGG